MPRYLFPTGPVLVAGLCMALVCAPWSGQAHAVDEASASVDAAPAAAAAPAAQPETPATPGPSGNWHARRGIYFQRTWGVDITGVRLLASGYMLEFRYRVLDVDKALTLNEKANTAYLVDNKTGTVLSVPAMENIGQLRQTTAPDQGRSYYIVFGNPGRLVRHGDQVTVVIGKFRVDDLAVD